MAYKNWFQSNPQATVHHLPLEESDHCPILIQTGKLDTQGRRPFKFMQAWVSDVSSREIVLKAWNMDKKGGMDCHKLKRSLANTTRAFKKWNRAVFGYTHTTIKRLEDELENLQNDDNNSTRQQQIIEELRNQRGKQESINIQKSKELWLKAGDCNSNFFHVSTLIRKKRNRISAIK